MEEYFALEEVSDIRHEYYRGEIFPLDGPQAMTGLRLLIIQTELRNCLTIGLARKRMTVAEVYEEVGLPPLQLVATVPTPV